MLNGAIACVLGATSCNLCSDYTQHGQAYCVACREAMARLEKIARETAARPVPKEDIKNRAGEFVHNPQWDVEYRLRKVLTMTEAMFRAEVRYGSRASG